MFRFYVTVDRNVFRQNVCSLLTRLEIFSRNQKLPVTIRILCSFRVRAQKCLLCFIDKSNKIIFEKSQKLVWDKNLFYTFLYLRTISIQNWKLGSLFIYHLVEQKRTYKTHFLKFFCLLIRYINFHFSKVLIIGKIDFLIKNHFKLKGSLNRMLLPLLKQRSQLS